MRIGGFEGGEQGGKVERILPRQLFSPFFQRVEIQFRRSLPEGHHGNVAVAFRRHFQYFSVKRFLQISNKARIAFVAAPPVGHENAFVRQRLPAVGKKSGADQIVDNLFAVETVGQNDVGAAAQGFDVLRAVGLDDFECFPFKRQLEQAARHGDDVRVDFHRGLAAVGQAGVYPAGERTAAQPDLRDVDGRVGKQQPGHHRAAVR